MVLTQLEVEYEDLATLLDKFPYHYGSYATLIKAAVDSETKTFPYHYGSHATQSRVHQ